MVRRLLVAAAGAAACVVLLTAVAAAPSVTVRSTKEGAGLVVGGKLIAIFRVPNGNSSPQRRAEIAAERLRTLLELGIEPRDIEARRRGESWGVYVSDDLLMIATLPEARERQETPEA